MIANSELAGLLVCLIGHSGWRRLPFILYVRANFEYICIREMQSPVLSHAVLVLHRLTAQTPKLFQIGCELWLTRLSTRPSKSCE